MQKSLWNRALWPLIGLCLLVIVGVEARAAVSPARRASEKARAASAAPPASDHVAAEGRVVTYPGAEVIVGTDLAGTIVFLRVQEKDAVRKGQLLAELRSDDYRAALSEARARVIEADADIRLAQAELERARTLWDKAVGSRQALDKAERDLDAARARRATAAATADRLEAVLAKTRILSPIDGVVITRHAQPGETLEAGKKILTVADLTKTRIEAELDEFDAGRVALGARASVTAEGYDGKRWRGKVEEIPDSVVGRKLKPQDPGKPEDTRVLLVKIALSEPTPLKLGQRVEIRIENPEQRRHPMSSEAPVVKRLQCRGAEPGLAPAPLDSSGERDFLSERLALYFSAVLAASAAFFLAGRVIYLWWPAPVPYPIGWTEPFLLFHLAAIALLLVMWLAVRQHGLSQMALHWMDALGTIAVFVLFALMAANMPGSWRPESIVLLATMASLLYRAAMVPSDPRRTAWISALAVFAIPFVAYRVHKNTADLSPGAAAANSFLWALLAVGLSTIVSFVTFRLRHSVARARRLGQYTLGEKLGEGGMGIVYRAEHEMLRRPTAIKLLPPGRAGEDSLKRFEREVRQTARLTSPHTVVIYDYGRTPDGLFYYVMEYLDGIDLEDLVKEGGPVAPGRAVRILRQVCAALAEAHGIGLIHRDIKPANILLCERGGFPDIAKVLDFGLVREISSSSDPRLTAENVLHGTPQYLAPESIRNADDVDARSDLYSLGAVGYFLLTGTPVFSGRGALEIIHHHLQTEPEPLSKRLGRSLPPKLEAVVMACLSKNPDERPESARALADMLHACDDVAPWDENAARSYWHERSRRKSAAKTA